MPVLPLPELEAVDDADVVELALVDAGGKYSVHNHPPESAQPGPNSDAQMQIDCS